MLLLSRRPLFLQKKRGRSRGVAAAPNTDVAELDSKYKAILKRAKTLQEGAVIRVKFADTDSKRMDCS